MSRLCEDNVVLAPLQALVARYGRFCELSRFAAGVAGAARFDRPSAGRQLRERPQLGREHHLRCDGEQFQRLTISRSTIGNSKAGPPPSPEMVKCGQPRPARTALPCSHTTPAGAGSMVGSGGSAAAGGTSALPSGSAPMLGRQTAACRRLPGGSAAGDHGRAGADTRIRQNSQMQPARSKAGSQRWHVGPVYVEHQGEAPRRSVIAQQVHVAPAWRGPATSKARVA